MRRFACKIKSAATGDFTEHGNVPRNNGKVVAGPLDQRQTEAFVDTGGNQAGAGGVDMIQIFVTDTVQPEEAFVQFGVTLQTFDGFGNVASPVIRKTDPAFFAYDHQINIDAFLPEFTESFDSLQITLARLDGADHQKTGTGLKLMERRFGIDRQTQAG